MTTATAALLQDFAEANGMTAKPEAVRRNIAVVRALCKAANITTVEELTAGKVEGFLLAEHRNGKSAHTIHNYHGAISRFCGYLTRKGVLSENVAHGIPLPAIEERPPIYLTEQEIDLALRIARRDHIFCEVVLALYTGLRMTELRLLEWKDVNLRWRYLIVRKSKSRRPRKVWLSRGAIEALKEQQGKTGQFPHVFPGGRPGGTINGRGAWARRGPRGHEWWTSALEGIQGRIEKFQQLPKQTCGRGWHLFRHTFASRAVQAGVSLYKVSQWLGHRNMTTTQRYAHLQTSFDDDIERIGKGNDDEC